MSDQTVVEMSRRAVLGGAAVAALGGIVGWAVARNSAAAKRTVAAAANGYQFQPPSSGGGRRLVPLASVPVGGGVVVPSARVVLTRDAGGVLHAFSALCTHQGCVVTSVRRGTINCPCHGSRFDAGTGAVVAGPAPAGLAPVTVEVTGGVVYAK